MNKKIGPPTFGDGQLAEVREIVEERRWGYILNAPGKSYAGMTMLQRLSVVTAAYILAVSLSVMLPIFMGMANAADPMRILGAVFLMGLALPFCWYATRGNKAYVYVNIYRNEVREVVPNLIGKPTILRRVPFAEIGGVRIEKPGNGARALLSLYRGGEWRRIAVLEGCQRELTHLREKLAKDLFGQDMAESFNFSAANITGLPPLKRRNPRPIAKLA